MTLVGPVLQASWCVFLVLLDRTSLKTGCVYFINMYEVPSHTSVDGDISVVLKSSCYWRSFAIYVIESHRSCLCHQFCYGQINQTINELWLELIKFFEVYTVEHNMHFLVCKSSTNWFLLPEFLEVGKKQPALDVLYDVMKSKKHRTWQKIHEPIMLKYLELCVDLRKSHLAKEGLYQYKNICQQVWLLFIYDCICCKHGICQLIGTKSNRLVLS